MATVICPKCGWKQNDGVDCQRCGIVFSRYKVSPETKAKVNPYGARASPALFRLFYRVFRWVAVALSILVLTLMLRNPPPPAVQIDPGAEKRAETKLHQLQSAAKEGKPYTLQLDETELNSWLRSTMTLAAKREETVPGPGQEDIEKVRSTVRDVKIQLIDDRLRGYVLFDFHGKDLSLVLEGRLFVENGYLRLQPTRGTLGALPLPQSSLKSAVARLFDRPENKEAFHLPPGIRDIRVEHSELIVVRR